jgi:hypothetical protein
MKTGQLATGDGAGIRCRGSHELRCSVALGALCLAVVATAQPLTGGSFAIVGAPAAAGLMSGGTYRLAGYVAASGANTSSGDTYDLTCGLVGLYGVAGDGVVLRAELGTTGHVRLWWPADAVGYELETRAALDPLTGWQPVDPAPTGNELFVSPAGPARFYRLRQP